MGSVQDVQWSICQLSNGGAYFLVAAWVYLLSHSHCPLGVGNTCFAYPLTIAFTTRTWRWNAPEVRNMGPFKTSIPKIYS